MVNYSLVSFFYSLGGFLLIIPLMMIGAFSALGMSDSSKFFILLFFLVFIILLFSPLIVSSYCLYKIYKEKRNNERLLGWVCFIVNLLVYLIGIFYPIIGSLILA